MSTSRCALAVAVAAALAGCSSDADSVFLTGGFPDQSIGGVWEGTDSSGQSVFGLATETGEFQFASNDGTQVFGTATATAAQVSGDASAAPEFGTTFGDGSTFASGTISGTVRQRQSLSAQVLLTTATGVPGGTVFTLTFNTLYNRPSSLATVAGTFTDTASGATATIDPTGGLTSTDPGTGCVLDGQVTVANGQFNVYTVEFSYSSCVGTAAALNGATFNGLATLDNSSTPEQLIVLGTAESGTAGVSLVIVLDRT